MDTLELESFLSELPMGGIKYFETVDSTNCYALEWAEKGAEDFSLVVANEQTAGRGRMARKWLTTPGNSLAMSLILRPSHKEQKQIHLFSPLAGLAVAESLKNTYGLNPLIKWPNDILLDHKKVCGILCEAAWDKDELRGMVIGIGLNLKNESIPTDDSLRYPASSLESAGCDCLEVLPHIRNILLEFRRLRPILATSEFITKWESYLAFKGEQVILTAPEKDPEIFTLIGLDAEGNLHVIDSAGDEKFFQAGEISLRPFKS